MTSSSDEFELTVRLLERRLTATRNDTAFEDCTVHCPTSAGAKAVNLCPRSPAWTVSSTRRTSSIRFHHY